LGPTTASKPSSPVSNIPLSGGFSAPYSDLQIPMYLSSSTPRIAIFLSNLPLKKSRVALKPYLN
jgi:hypothetical protein